MDNTNTIGRMYVIVDMTGSYYKVNDNDQLVQVSNKEEADVFNITDAYKRISGGKKAHFYSVLPIEEQDGEEGIVTCELSKIDWLDYLTGFRNIAMNLSTYREQLNHQLSETDLEICDLLHYIELYEIADGEAMDVLEQLHVCRERRRMIKDEMQKIDYMEKALLGNSIVAKVNESIKAIQKMDTRKYTPRKLEDLFQGAEKRTGIIYSRKTKLFHEPELISQEESGVNDVHMDEILEEWGDSAMEYVRRATVYDGKKNDWRQFVSMQAEFYANAEQYIYNLNIDLDEIENEIEDILTQIENVNYNAAQGYKVFKHLKELRNERADKLQELESLEMMISGIDCKYMVELFQQKLKVVEKIMGVEQDENTVVVDMAG